ncbi:MAG: tyrosine--tRNA ligase [Planctomycetota bacterium]|nr:tyrosine--tRNA ligase [Planctomycetota bacterium]
MSSIPQEQYHRLVRGSVMMTTEAELKKRLSLGRPLRVKLGVDPSSSDLHLGHTVVLRKLRQFQDEGHQAVLIIGDFTGLVGDPTGRSKTRPQLTPEQVDENAKTYIDQVEKVLDISKLEIVRNSQWLKPLTLYQLIQLASKMTVAHFLERDDFQKRYRGGVPIGIHEFLYLIMQAYDSVEVKADIELGGTDQTFNLMVGRDLMRDMGMEPQCAMTMPLLVGTDGKEKMSKSYGNHVGISMEAFEMYSRILSLPDDLMKDYYTLLTLLPGDEVDRLCDGEKTHPKAAKDRLAREVAAAYYPREEVDVAAKRWEEKFSQKKVTDVKELTLEEKPVALIPLLRATGIPKSNGEARRLIEQGGVEIDGSRMVDPKVALDLKEGAVLRVGKKRQFFRVTWS